MTPRGRIVPFYDREFRDPVTGLPRFRRPALPFPPTRRKDPRLGVAATVALLLGLGFAYFVLLVTR